MIYRETAGGLRGGAGARRPRVNDPKWGILLDTIAMEMADEDEVLQAVGAPPGSWAR